MSIDLGPDAEPDPVWTEDTITADLAGYVGAVVRAATATISDDADLDLRDFPRGILIRVTGFAENDLQYHARERLTDTWLEGDALPDQLPADEHVAWFWGPTYHDDGRVTGRPTVVGPAPPPAPPPPGAVDDPTYRPEGDL